MEVGTEESLAHAQKREREVYLWVRYQVGKMSLNCRLADYIEDICTQLSERY